VILAESPVLSGMGRRVIPPLEGNSLVSLVAGQSPNQLESYAIMADFEKDRGDELMAIPRLAERIGVTPRVIRYWEEQGLLSPTREHGKLRYSPRDMAIARLTKRLIDSGVGVEGLRMLKDLSERDIRRAADAGDETTLLELALRILYQRKAFREETGMDEEHYPEGRPPPPPPPPRGPHHAPKPHSGPRDRRGERGPGP
jgi:DNA-binding transcriptional MerR regulator